MNFETIKSTIEIVIRSLSLVALIVLIYYLIILEFRSWQNRRNSRKRIGIYSEYVWIARDRYGLHVFMHRPSYNLVEDCYAGISRRLPEPLSPSLDVNGVPVRVKIIYEIFDYSDKKHNYQYMYE